MAQVPRLRRLSAEDLPGFEKLLEALNPFLSDVTGAFEHRLTWDNFASTVKVVEVTAATVMAVTVSCPELPGQARHVVVTRCEDITSTPTPFVAPQIAWDNAPGQVGIVIRAHSGLTNGNKYRLTLLVTV